MADPYIDNVVLLLHCDGTNGATTFTDKSRYTQSVAAGTGTTTSTTEKKFGTASANFTVSASGLTSTSTVYPLGSDDFTLECWVYAPSGTWDDLGPYGPIINIGTASTAGRIQLGLNNDSGSPYLVAFGYTTTTISLAVPDPIVAFPTDQWVHVALTRAGNVFKTWVNGVQLATTTQTFTSNITTIKIGHDSGNALAGYIDDVRITKGVARYTTTFTPPTAAFDDAPTPPEPYFYYTTALLHLDGANNGTTFTDSGPLANTVTRVGTTVTTTSQLKFGTASGLFNGSTDGLSLTGSDLILGTGDFTIEFFVRLPTEEPIPDQYPVIFAIGEYDNAGSMWISYDPGGDITATGRTGISSFVGLGANIASPSTGAWHHVALTRSGTTCQLWFNGVSTGSVVAAMDISQSTYRIAYDGSSTSDGFFQGAIDEVRVTKGIARYSTTFTPTTSAFPDATPPSAVIEGSISQTINFSRSIIFGFASTLSENTTYSEATDALHLRIANLLESVNLQSTADAYAKLYQVLSESILTLDTLNVALPVDLADSIQNIDAIAIIRATAVAEMLGLSDFLIPAGRYNVNQSDVVAWVDSLRNFFGQDFSDAINISTALSPVQRAFPTLSDSFAVSEIFGGNLIFKLVSQDTVNLDDIDVLKMIFASAVAEGIEIAAAYIAPDGNLTTWAVNTETGAVTEYTNYGFNSFAQIGYKSLGASSDGLYELNGDTDAGDDIVSVIKSGLAQFGGSRFTMFKAAYMGVRGGGEYVLRLETGDGRYYDYNVIAQDMQTTKVRLGKGLRARYFSFELTSTGQDFDLDSVEFVPLVAQRRV